MKTRSSNSPVKTNRRTFIANSALGTAGFLVGCKSNHIFGTASKELPMPCAPEAWQKHGIILEPTEPWEGNNIQNFTTRADPIGSDRWRMWYSVSDEKKGYTVAYAEGSPERGWKKVPAVCSAGEPGSGPFSIGNLPSGWKPVQPTHVQLGNGKHRLYFWAHGPEISRYLVAESEDGRAYRVADPLRPVLYHPNDRASFGVPSPDGITYRSNKSRNRPTDEPLAVPRLISNDATTIYQLPNGTFELYSVALLRVGRDNPAYIAEDNAPGLLRVIDRYTSTDGLHFDTRQRIIERDANDPVDQQFYYLSVTMTPRGRVGMLGHYRCAAQTMDLEWCFSSDGVTWNRPLRRAWLPRGNPPAADCFGIYAGSQLIYRNGLWHLFYTGVNSSHNGKKSYGRPRQVVMYATTKSIWG